MPARSLFQCLICAIVLSLSSAVFAESIITEWNPIIINGVIRDRPAPTVGTHVMSSVFSAAYEAWSIYDATATGAYAGNTLDVPGGTEGDQIEAISHAIYTTLVAFAPTNQATYENFMLGKGYVPGASTENAILGRAAAQAVIDFRVDDGSNQPNGYMDTTGYMPRSATIEDAWQPLLVGSNLQKPLTPHWKNVIPFALKRADQYRPPQPAAPGSERWDNQIQQILDFSANLTDRHKAITEYWLPLRGTPPMLLAGLTEQVSSLKGFGLEEDVKLFFAIHNAMFDAGIATWESKYHYDYVRPITAVRNIGDVTANAWAGPGLGTQEILCSAFLPYQFATSPTPPFPEYTSGHSTFSSAWAEVMRSFTGSDYFGGSVTIDRLAIEDVDLTEPILLEWPTFTAAAEEAGISRLYGGIHFMDGNRNGLVAGTLVGATVWDKAKALFEGLPDPVMDVRADVNRDGAVDAADILILQANWQRSED
jgi:hypothetical protein